MQSKVVILPSRATWRRDNSQVAHQEPTDLLPLSDTPPDPEEVRRTRRRGRRVLVVVLAVLGGLLFSLAAGVWTLTNHYAGQVRRVPSALPAVPDSERPPRSAGEGLTFLLVGLDRRSDVPTTGEQAEGELWKPGAQRADSIMVVRLTADRQEAYVVSVPRDSWVPIPGHRSAKINAAFSFGGPALLVLTVEKVTGIRIDHVAMIDWDGFRSLTDALGGVTVTIPQDSHDSARGRRWKSGTHTLRGDDALDYVRQRYGLPRGDLDRVARQQNFLRAIMEKTLQQETLTNPIKLTRLMGAVTDTVSVDDSLSNGDLRGLALRLRHLRRDDVTFLTAPFGRFARIDGQSAVILDAAKSKALWEAVRTDRLAGYLDRYGESPLGPTVN